MRAYVACLPANFTDPSQKLPAPHGQLCPHLCAGTAGAGLNGDCSRFDCLRLEGLTFWSEAVRELAAGGAKLYASLNPRLRGEADSLQEVRVAWV
jgi:hypothetical protein